MACFCKASGTWCVSARLQVHGVFQQGFGYIRCSFLQGFRDKVCFCKALGTLCVSARLRVHGVLQQGFGKMAFFGKAPGTWCVFLQGSKYVACDSAGVWLHDVEFCKALATWCVSARLQVHGVFLQGFRVCTLQSFSVILTKSFWSRCLVL